MNQGHSEHPDVGSALQHCLLSSGHSRGACDLILPHVIKNRMTKHVFQALLLFISAVAPSSVLIGTFGFPLIREFICPTVTLAPELELLYKDEFHSHIIKS